MIKVTFRPTSLAVFGAASPCPVPRTQLVARPYPAPTPAVHPTIPPAGDWLQGPYIYALYEHYGYGVGDIGRFFIMGFGSSLLLGTAVGALADKQ